MRQASLKRRYNRDNSISLYYRGKLFGRYRTFEGADAAQEGFWSYHAEKAAWLEVNPGKTARDFMLRNATL